MAAGDKTIEGARILIESAHSVSDTIDRLEATLKDKGMGVFGRVDHAANAKKVDLDMPETQVLIFGNPKLGTKLMLSAPSIALDLPLKMLAAIANDGKVYLSWIDPAHLRTVHGVDNCDEQFDMISTALLNIATSVASAD